MNYRIYVKTDQINSYCQSSIQEFTKRLGSYCKFELFTHKKETLLLKKEPKQAFQIQICETGTKKSSEELAAYLNQLGISGTSDISFYIGLEPKYPNDQLCISSMDMDPGLTAAIVAEQIYRSYRINCNQAYHK